MNAKQKAVQSREPSHSVTTLKTISFPNFQTILKAMLTWSSYVSCASSETYASSIKSKYLLFYPKKIENC